MSGASGRGGSDDAATAADPPARRRERNPEKTRRKVLDAAKAEFAENGLNGARIDAIARRSGSNVQVIYHYFNSKDDLFTAVIADLYADDWLFREWGDLDARDPAEAVALLLKCIARKYLSDDAFVRLLVDENAHKARHVSKIPEIHLFYEKVIASLSRVLKRGQDMGIFRRDIDAQLFYVLAISAIGGGVTGRFTLSEALSGEPLANDTGEVWLEHINRLLLRGLRPD